MGAITKLVVLCIRLTWLLTIGWLLGGLYLLPGVLMSPFHATYGMQNAKRRAVAIMWLKPRTPDN